jgi:flagellar hook-associated protein 1 FlgK
MPNVFGTLNIARQGMMVSQIGLDLTGHNTANVNTEGYSRRQMVVASRMQILGGGAEFQSIRRYTDQFATERLIHEETLRGFAEQKGNILSHVSDLFNDLEDTGLGSALDAFYGAFRLLESNPSDLTVRQEVIARTEELAQAFNRISTELETVRENTDNLLRASAAEINVRSEEIAQLNSDIVMAKMQNKDTSDIMDRREQLVREMAEHADITFIENDNGQITVFLEGGLPVVEGINYSRLQVLDSAVPGGARVEYVTESGQISDITSSIEGGSMGGTLETRDVILPSLASDLDQLAYDITQAYNAVHSAGVGLDDPTGVLSRNLFVPLGSAANAAANIAIDPAVDGNPEAIAAAWNGATISLPGDNRNALDLAALADQDLANGGTQTFNEAYATLVGEVGVATRRAEAESEMRSASITRIEAIRDSESGVSLDEEMTNLVQYQRAYQASARVLNAITTVLDTIINLGS